MKKSSKSTIIFARSGNKYRILFPTRGRQKRTIVFLFLCLSIILIFLPILILKSGIASNKKDFLSLITSSFTTNTITNNGMKLSSPLLSHIYKCNKDSYNNIGTLKLVFLHVFQNTESKIISFFRDYARLSHSSLLIIKDSNLTNYSLSNYDIVAGNMKINSMFTFPGYENILYITFFRDAISKYVSEIMYSIDPHNSRTIKYYVETIKNTVEFARLAGYYHDGYTRYLITPTQEESLDPEHGIEKRIHLVQNNIWQYNILIGIFENISQSMEIISYCIDKDKELTQLFDQYVMQNQLHKDMSMTSISSIITILKQDLEFYPILKEYLKYDQILFEFAFKIHMKQYKYIHQKKQHSLNLLRTFSQPKSSFVLKSRRNYTNAIVHGMRHVGSNLDTSLLQSPIFDILKYIEFRNEINR